MKQALYALLCTFVLSVSGVQTYYPNPLLNVPRTNNLPFAVEYGWDKSEAANKTMPVSVVLKVNKARKSQVFKMHWDLPTSELNF